MSERISLATFLYQRTAGAVDSAMERISPKARADNRRNSAGEPSCSRLLRISTLGSSPKILRHRPDAAAVDQMSTSRREAANFKKMVAQAQPHKRSQFGPHKQAGRSQYVPQCYLPLSRRSDYQSAVRARLFDKQHPALRNAVLASRRIPLAGPHGFRSL
jgi:hypothetical protein